MLTIKQAEQVVQIMRDVHSVRTFSERMPTKVPYRRIKWWLVQDFDKVYKKVKATGIDFEAYDRSIIIKVPVEFTLSGKLRNAL